VVEVEHDGATVGIVVANKVGCRKCYNRFRAKGLLKDMRRTGIQTVMSYEDRLAERLTPTEHADVFREVDERVRAQAAMKYGADKWNAQPAPAGSRRFHLLRVLQERGYDPEQFGFKLTKKEQLKGEKSQQGHTCTCAYCETSNAKRGRKLSSGDWLCVACADMPID